MIKISFLGDISLNDQYNDYYNNGSNPFGNISSYLKDSDFVVGNLECMCKGNQGENLLKKPRLKTDTNTLDFLKDINLTTATLAHNHIYDNLESGYEKTINKLDELNINHLGAGYSNKEASSPLVIEKDNIKIAYLNYVTSDTNPNIPDGSRLHVNKFDLKNIKSEIKNIKKDVDFIVCLFHWGGRVEKGMYPDYDQPKMAYDIIDSGADLIIGHHSHTLQPYEVYNGKYIFYSLGNFCFSDTYSDGRLHEMDKNSGCKSIIVNINFHKEYYNVAIQHIKNVKLFVTLNNKKDVEKDYLKRINIFHIIKNKKWMWNIYWLKHKHYNPLKFYFFGNNKDPIHQLRKLDLKKITNFLRKKLKGQI